MPAQIVVLDNGKVITLPTVIPELQKRGYDLVIYRSQADFGAARAPLARADVVLASGGFRVTPQMIKEAPQLRALVACAIGTDGFDEPLANELCVFVAHGQPREHVMGMAEATILLMLACLHDLPRDEKIMRQNQPRTPKTTGRLIAGKTIGIIGLGQIGRAVARLLANWGVRLLAYAPRLHDAPPDGVTMVGLEDLLRTSDIVTVHASLTAETRHLLNAERLALMKSDAVLINTARGGIIDDTALYAQAKANRIGWIGLDVTETEPLPPDSPLLQLPNAILTPHMLGGTREAAEQLTKMALENVENALAGKLPVCLRNPHIAPAWLRKWEGRSLVSRSAGAPHSPP